MCDTRRVTATGARARVRAELTREITEVARRHLASGGASALSLRAVARELGMASSALYRYFPSRDDLLTALIVDAYDALGGAAEAADARVAREDLRGRWVAVCRSAREWAIAHPHEYALVYGTPVPGYAAPQTTIGPASRVGEVLCGQIRDGVAAGAIATGADATGADATLAPGIAERIGLSAGTAGPMSSLAARAIFGWTALFGMISFELFGHMTNVVEHREEFFTDAANRVAVLIGVP